MSDLFVDNIKHQSSQGSGTITLGTSGETISLASGAEVSGFTGQNYPGFLLIGNGTVQSIPNSSYTKVSNLTEAFDSDNAVSSAKFTVPTGKGGNYLVHGSTSWVGNGTGARITAIFKNGSEIIRFSNIMSVSSGTNALVTGASLINLTEGDYIELYAYQGSGGNLNLQSSVTARVRFGGIRVGA